MIEERRLERGSEGEDVKEMQEILAKMGYGLGASGIDGKFGENTKAALKQFQSETNQQIPGANILVDGKTDRHTWIFLRKNSS